MIAALYVQPRGCYINVPGVDPWPKSRDARLYAGPYPVVAHPPCARWCQLAGLVEARWGHKRGEDGGCFAAALEAVRTYGGVLEHPAYSRAWDHFGLVPPLPAGWQQDVTGGWSCHVEQSRYGHPARKGTWLYAYGVSWLPSLEWGISPNADGLAVLSQCGNRTTRGPLGRITKRRASATPIPFRDLLLSIARTAQRQKEAA